MSKITTITTLPPQVQRYFDSELLSHPCKLRDDSSDLELVKNTIIDTLWHKLKNQPGKKVKCEKLLEAYQKLYERIIEKEKEQEGKTGYKTQMLFYFFGSVDSESDDIFRRLRYKRANSSH